MKFSLKVFIGDSKLEPNKKLKSFFLKNRKLKIVLIKRPANIE